MSPAAPIILIAAFLAISGCCHFLAPEQSEKILSKEKPVRFVGGVLSLLGAWCLFSPGFKFYFVGIPTLLSGLARFFAPRRMIKLNAWTSRYVHGLLMLLGGLACVLLLFA